MWSSKGSLNDRSTRLGRALAMCGRSDRAPGSSSHEGEDASLLVRLLSRRWEGSRSTTTCRPFAAPAHRRPAPGAGASRSGSRRSMSARRASTAARGEARAALEDLGRFAPLGATIRSFWLDLEHQRSPRGWSIAPSTKSCSATALVPDGHLLRRSFSSRVGDRRVRSLPFRFRVLATRDSAFDLKVQASAR